MIEPYLLFCFVLKIWTNYHLKSNLKLKQKYPPASEVSGRFFCNQNQKKITHTFTESIWCLCFCDSVTLSAQTTNFLNNQPWDQSLKSIIMWKQLENWLYILHICLIFFSKPWTLFLVITLALIAGGYWNLPHKFHLYLIINKSQNQKMYF